MRLYLYAIVDRLTEVSGLSGVAGEPVVLVSAPGMGVAGGWMSQPPAIDRDTLGAQDRIVRELHARAAALLPLRFGTSVADESELAQKLESLGPELGQRLDLVRAREQMTLRVLKTESTEGDRARTGDPRQAEQLEFAGPVRGAGTEYLLRRAATTPPELAALTDALRPYQRATRIERGRVENVIATIYHLIERGSGDVYRAAVSETVSQFPAFSVRVTGPSPAYAFASLTSASRAAPDQD